MNFVAGFAANNVSENYDAKIFAVATLISSHLIYNSVKIIDQADIDYLELLARRTQLFALRSQLSRAKWNDGFVHDLLSFPPLLWVVQDFVQTTLDNETPTQWLHRLMETHSRESEDYKISLLDIFKSLECHTLFLPAVKRLLLTDLSEVVSKIEGPVATIAVVGKFHSGKSFLMNQLMGKTKGFGIGPTVRPETMGIWMWGQVGDSRPISLLCSDYKILAKILARRLDTGLKSIIGPHQTYSLRGRKISRNLHIMRAIGEATAEGHQSLAVLQLDLQQAFDRVSHRFLLAALDRFGVGEELRGWIALCYRDISTRLLINGQRGGPISTGRSVRQGCPLSPILFALQLEPLCRAVNADPSISGLRLGDKDVRVLAFADDDSSICSSKVQVQTILQHVDRFCAASGAMINKSAGALLGACETTPRTFGGIGWSTSLNGYLGVPVDPQRSTAAVWRPTANSVAAELSPWRCRNLSFFSRAHVCNTVSYPAVLYKAQAVCCPGSQAGKVHRSWAMFVWKTAMESTRRNNLFLHEESGGLGLVNIVLKLHVQCFLLFRDARDPTFVAVLHHLGFPHLGN
ncbi:hypothetical protein ISCGN_014788 [Ixodes scapularis]